VSAYTVALLLHSWNRWLLVILGVVLLVRSAMHWREGSESERWLDHVNKGFIGSLDLQFVLGLALYFVLSPLTKASFADMSATMSDSVARFWALEHPFAMFFAVLVAHVGSAVRGRRDGVAKHKPITIALILWALITISSIPWPGLAHGRVLFRF
jgi:hypothetical protein